MPDKSTTPVQGLDVSASLSRADEVAASMLATDYAFPRDSVVAMRDDICALVAEVERLRARHDEEADDNATHLREAEGERDAAVKRAEEAERKADFLEGERLSGLKLAYVLTVERDAARQRLERLEGTVEGMRS